jgi:hypothetical protein
MKAAEPGKNPAWGEQLMRQAARLAINRTVAGVHFPVDSAAGAMLGLTLGQYLLHRCGQEANYVPARFNGQTYAGADDFEWRHFYDLTLGNDVRTFPVAPLPLYAEGFPANNVAPSGLLAWLWGQALTEWP